MNKNNELWKCTWLFFFFDYKTYVSDYHYAKRWVSLFDAILLFSTLTCGVSSRNRSSQVLDAGWFSADKTIIQLRKFYQFRNKRETNARWKLYKKDLIITRFTIDVFSVTDNMEADFVSNTLKRSCKTITNKTKINLKNIYTLYEQTINIKFHNKN